MARGATPQNGHTTVPTGITRGESGSGVEGRISARITELRGHLEQLATQEARLRAALEQTILQTAATRGAIGELESALHPTPTTAGTPAPVPGEPQAAPEQEA